MVDFEYQDLFLESSIDKQMTITCEDGSVITNKDLYLEDFTLNESLCSENSLVFGTCEASSISFRVKNIYNTLKDQWITVKTTLDNNSDAVFQYGKYKVFSDTPSADRSYRDIVAYDVMYDIINTDVKEWYNGLSFPITLKNFRKSFADYFGLQEVTQTLCNDNLSISKTLSFADTDALSGKTIINAIAEINGVFGHITRDNKIKYVALKENNMALFPRDDLYPADDLFPKDWDNYNYNVGSKYSDCTYEDYMCDRIAKLSIYGSDDGVATSAGVDGNEYKIVGNFLISDKNTEQLQSIAQNILNVIKVVDYRAYNCKILRGNPCLEVGDSLRISTENCLILSYVLQRTMTGIHALKDTYEAKGSKEVENAVNSIQSSFTSINNKFHKVTNTLEEFSSEIYDGEGNSKITQVANEISTEVSNRQSDVSSLSSRISQTASSISTEVSNRQSAVNALSTKISQTAHSISLSAEDKSTSSSIVIRLYDENGNQLDSESANITLKGLVAFTDLSGNGTTTINGANITTGKIKADYIDVANLDAVKGHFNEFEVNAKIDDNASMVEKINDQNVIVGMDGGYYLKFGNDGSFGLYNNNNTNKIIQKVLEVQKRSLKSFIFDLDFFGKIKIRNWLNESVWEEGYPIVTGDDAYKIAALNVDSGKNVVVRSVFGATTANSRYIPTGMIAGSLDNLVIQGFDNGSNYSLEILRKPSKFVGVESGTLKVTGESNIAKITRDDGKYTTIKTLSDGTGYMIATTMASTQVTSQIDCITTGLKIKGRWNSSDFEERILAVPSSDSRLKHNINDTEIDCAVDIINQIDIKSFDWNDGRGHQKIGFIAQQLEEIDDKLVNSEGTYKAIDTFYLQGYEVKAIQELSEQNKLLMSQNVSLKNEIDMLKSLLKEKGVI